jgi:hypothetical protein
VVASDRPSPDQRCRCFETVTVSDARGQWLAQVRAHLGYRPTDKDHRDLRLLGERLGLDLPPPYA